MLKIRLKSIQNTLKIVLNTSKSIQIQVSKYFFSNTLQQDCYLKFKSQILILRPKNCIGLIKSLIENRTESVIRTKDI